MLSLNHEYLKMQVKHIFLFHSVADLNSAWYFYFFYLFIQLVSLCNTSIYGRCLPFKVHKNVTITKGRYL